MYRRVEIKDGETAEPVQFVGVHPVAWPTRLLGTPDAAFVEADGIEAKLTAAEALATVAAQVQKLLHEEALEYRPVSITCDCHWSECDHQKDPENEDVEHYAELATAAEQLDAALCQYREVTKEVTK